MIDRWVPPAVLGGVRHRTVPADAQKAETTCTPITQLIDADELKWLPRMVSCVPPKVGPKTGSTSSTWTLTYVKNTPVFAQISRPLNNKRVVTMPGDRGGEMHSIALELMRWQAASKFPSQSCGLAPCTKLAPETRKCAPPASLPKLGETSLNSHGS